MEIGPVGFDGIILNLLDNEAHREFYEAMSKGNRRTGKPYQVADAMMYLKHNQALQEEGLIDLIAGMYVLSPKGEDSFFLTQMTRSL